MGEIYRRGELPHVRLRTSRERERTPGGRNTIEKASLPFRGTERSNGATERQNNFSAVGPLAALVAKTWSMRALISGHV